MAEEFATDTRHCAVGGSVTLRTLAPAEAIVAPPQDGDDHDREAESFVDPRRLGIIHVHRSYPQIAWEEIMALEDEDDGAEPPGAATGGTSG